MSLALVTVIVAIGLVLWTAGFLLWIQISSYDRQSKTKLTALPDFNWKETEPIKARPFKSKYNLTMGVYLCIVIEPC